MASHNSALDFIQNPTLREIQHLVYIENGDKRKIACKKVTEINDILQAQGFSVSIPEQITDRHIAEVEACTYDQKDDTISNWKLTLHCQDDSIGVGGRIQISPKMIQGIWVKASEQRRNYIKFVRPRFTTKPFKQFCQRAEFTKCNNQKQIKSTKSLTNKFKKWFGEKSLKVVIGSIMVDDFLEPLPFTADLHLIEDKKISLSRGIPAESLIRAITTKMEAKKWWNKDVVKDMKNIKSIVMKYKVTAVTPDGEQTREFQVPIYHPEMAILLKKAQIPLRFTGDMTSPPKHQQRVRRKSTKESKNKPKDQRVDKTYDLDASVIEITGVIHVYTYQSDPDPLIQREVEQRPSTSSSIFTQKQHRIIQPQPHQHPSQQRPHNVLSLFGSRPLPISMPNQQLLLSFHLNQTCNSYLLRIHSSNLNTNINESASVSSELESVQEHVSMEVEAITIDNNANASLNRSNNRSHNNGNINTSSSEVGSRSSITNDNASLQVSQQQNGNNMRQSYNNMNTNGSQMMQQQQQGNFNGNYQGAPSASNNRYVVNQGLNGPGANGNYNGNQNQLQFMSQNPNMHMNMNLNQNMNMFMHHQLQQQQNPMNPMHPQEMHSHPFMHPQQMQLNPMQYSNLLNPIMSPMYNQYQIQQQQYMQQMKQRNQQIMQNMQQMQQQMETLQQIQQRKVAAFQCNVPLQSQQQSSGKQQFKMRHVYIVAVAMNNYKRDMSKGCGRSENEHCKDQKWDPNKDNKHKAKLILSYLYISGVEVRKDELDLNLRDFRAVYNDDDTRNGKIQENLGSVKKNGHKLPKHWQCENSRRYPTDIVTRVFPWH